MISASDTTTGQNDYILKVHLDKFKLLQSGLAETPIPSDDYFVLYPNPTNGEFYLKPKSRLDFRLEEVRLIDIHGRVIESRRVNENQPISFHDYISPGMYFVEWTTISGVRGTKKILVMN